MSSYSEKQKMPTLKELSTSFSLDEEIEYVTEKSQKIGAKKYDVPSENPVSIYTKLNDYPYEFEIDSSLRLAKIDGVEVADNTTGKSENNVSREEYNAILARIGALEENKVSKEEHNTLLNRVEKLEKNKIKSGNVSFGGIAPGGVGIDKQIKFANPLESNNYTVVVSHTGNGDGWPAVGFSVTSKSVDGFTIKAYRWDSNDAMASIAADWILVMNE